MRASWAISSRGTSNKVLTQLIRKYRTPALNWIKSRRSGFHRRIACAEIAAARSNYYRPARLLFGQ